jgi:hypothetical protein
MFVTLSKTFDCAAQQLPVVVNSLTLPRPPPRHRGSLSRPFDGHPAKNRRDIHFPMSRIIQDDERITLERELQVLEQEHRDLDAAIDALARMTLPDQLQMQRLKRKKLGLKDRIVQIHGKLRPDIIA